MGKIAAPKLPVQSAVYLVICGAGILAFILAVIYPYKKNLVIMDRRIVETREQIETQKLLNPLFKTLMDHNRVDCPQELPRPVPGKLGRSEMPRLTNIFKSIGARSRVSITDLTPEVGPFLEKEAPLKIRIAARGAFRDLRRFLLDLARLPYVAFIETVEITAKDNGKELALLIWINQE